MRQGRCSAGGQAEDGALGDNTFANRLVPVAVPSFGMNIDPTATLVDARKVQVKVLALCQDDAHAMIRVALTQGGAIGYGFRGREMHGCDGTLSGKPSRFRPGRFRRRTGTRGTGRRRIPPWPRRRRPAVDPKHHAGRGA